MNNLVKITSEDICKALESFYTSPEWYLGFEVGNSTGAYCRRHADAVAINAYPSKGFETRGFEIKVSKSDLKSELDNGEKSDEIARFCDYWFLVVPKGLADGFTLPPTWGVIEYNGEGLRQKTKAEKLEKAHPTAGFLAAMLRGHDRVTESLARKVTDKREKEIEQRVLWRAHNSEGDLKRLHDRLEEVKKATGISLDSWTPDQYIIDRLNAAKALDIIAQNIRAIERTAKTLMQDAAEVQAAVATMRPAE
jgi:hypothetical protein